MFDSSAILVCGVLREKYPRFGVVKTLARPSTVLLDASDNGISIVPCCLGEENDVICIYYMGDWRCMNTGCNLINFFKSEFFLQEPRKDLLPNYEKIGRRGVTLP